MKLKDLSDFLNENNSSNNQFEINPCNFTDIQVKTLTDLLEKYVEPNNIMRLKCKCPCYRIIILNFDNLSDEIQNKIKNI